MADTPEALRLADAICDYARYGWESEVQAQIRRAKAHKEASAELRRLAAVEAERDALLALIADDAFAAAFQTIYWYRSALLKSAREPIDEALVEKGGSNG